MRETMRVLHALGRGYELRRDTSGALWLCRGSTMHAIEEETLMVMIKADLVYDSGVRVYDMTGAGQRALTHWIVTTDPNIPDE